MRYFGIKKPKTEQGKAFVYWLSTSEDDSWGLFFQCPDELEVC